MKIYIYSYAMIDNLRKETKGERIVIAKNKDEAQLIALGMNDSSVFDGDTIYGSIRESNRWDRFKHRKLIKEIVHD